MFDFVVDTELRELLESDYREMGVAFDAQAYKGAQVLAGSVVESVLADHLISLESEKLPRDKVLNMSLAKLIETAHDEGIIDETTQQLASVIRGYRNLIHPCRAARIEQSAVTPRTSQVACSVAAMIIEAVSKSRSSRLGLTAAQLVSKLVADPSATPILGQLLGSMSTTELDSFVLDVLPEAYLEREVGGAIPEEPWEDADDYRQRCWNEQRRLRAAYRAAYARSSRATKQEANQHIVSIITTEPRETVSAAEDAFIFEDVWEHFHASSDRDLVVEHLVGRMKDVANTPASMATKGILKYAKDSQVQGLMDRIVSDFTHRPGVMTGFYFGSDIYKQLEGEYQEDLDDRLETVLLDDPDSRHHEARVSALTFLRDEIPF